MKNYDKSKKILEFDKKYLTNSIVCDRITKLSAKAQLKVLSMWAISSVG